MDPISQSPNKSVDPLDLFKQQGSKFCFGSAGFKQEFNSYSKFLEEIYNVADRNVGERLMMVARGTNGSGNSSRAWSAFQSALALATEQLSTIPLLVFAYCNQASLVAAAGMSGSPYEGGVGGEVRRKLLTQLSVQSPLPQFCVERLVAAGLFYDEEEITALREGKLIEITDGMNGCEHERSNASDPSMQGLSGVSIGRTEIDSLVSQGSIGSPDKTRKPRSAEELKERLDRL